MNPIARLPLLAPDAMDRFARSLAPRLLAGDVVTLQGDVGAGKTAFARALIGAIAIGMPEVTSPTFTLMQSYDVEPGAGGKAVLWHLDLYRIESSEELEELGLEDIWPHIVLMEWPRIAASRLPASRLDIAISFDTTPATRSLTLSGNDAWRGRLAGLC